MITIPLTKGFVALIDDESAHLAELKWCVDFSAGKGKARGRPYAVRNSKGKKLRLHRVIMGVDDPAAFVDHDNGDTLDCQKHNLVVTTPTGNARNIEPSKANKSGYLGVDLQKDGRWRARISNGDRRIYIGSFATAELANAARLAAEAAAWGVMSRRAAAHVPQP